MRKRLPRPLCLSCGTIVERREDVYCNVRCQQVYAYKKRIEAWQAGQSVVIQDRSVPVYIRRYLFEKFQSKCTQCGWGEINSVTGKTPLEVEHIDGNSENNLEDNLTLLCPNCHSLTSTYKALNKGNGRFSRKQRYLNGKSH
jgi:hypothetical protein